MFGHTKGAVHLRGTVHAMTKRTMTKWQEKRCMENQRLSNTNSTKNKCLNSVATEGGFTVYNKTVFSL